MTVKIHGWVRSVSKFLEPVKQIKPRVYGLKPLQNLLST